MKLTNMFSRENKNIGFLETIGYYKLSVARRRVLRYVILGSLLAHVAGMTIFGSYVLVSSMLPEKTVFVTPPAMKTYEPRKLEFKVKVQKQQRSSSRPSMIPRMVSTKLSNIALPEIKVDPKIIKTSFQPKFKAVTGTGLGAGLGTGYGIGGFGTGVAAFDFFGIRGRTDRLAILVDVSVSMVEEERGGPAGYERVRQRLNKVIDALAEQAMFNVIVFADAASIWEKEIQVATADNKTKAKQFLKGYNTAGNYGLTSGNIQPTSSDVPAAGGTTRLDLALTAAFEQGADTILIISDGLPRVRKGVTAEQVAAHNSMVQKWQQDNAGAIQQYQAAAANFVEQTTSERVWIPEQPAVPARPPSKAPLKEGQAPDMGSPARPAIPGHWEVRTHRVGPARPAAPAPPPMADPGWWNLADFVRHLKSVHERYYVKKGKKIPVIHAIGYAIDKEGGDFLQGLTSIYKGRYRRVTKIE